MDRGESAHGNLDTCLQSSLPLRTVTVSILGSDPFLPSGEWRFIALARGPFCEPLRVDVLVDGKVEKTAVLNFQCGE